ncbi:MAG TPA: glycosyltransferase family 39 protein [Candidatus Udaeobacter sp.]|nr:glycosyltransferase family 39 protein [Candidatus Udaeobacter sp.]
MAHIPEFAHRLLDGDEAIYGTVAALMNLGDPLYAAGGVDNKPPGIFWVYAVTFRIFGAYQMTAVHAAGFLAMAATCVLIFFIARDVSGPRAGVIAALFYGLLTAAGNPRLLASNTEVFMMLPLVASVLAMLRRRWLWSGMLLVAAGAFRQSAAINVVLAAFALFWLEPGSERWRAAGRFGAGLVGGLIAGGVLIALTGSLSGFWRWTIQTLGGYASSNWNPSLVWLRARDSVVPFIVDMAVLWIAAIATATRWRSASPLLRLMVVWLAVAMVGSFAGGHLSWHYFIQAMGPLAVLAAVGLTTFRLRPVVAAAAIAGIAIPVAGWWLFDLEADPLTYDFSPPVPQHKAVADYVAAHTSLSDRVFIWGDWPAVYVESDRLMSSRFPGFLRGFARGSGLPPDNWDTAPDVWPLLASDLAAHPPALIVDTASAGWSDFAAYPMSNYPVVEALVESRYHPVATVGGVVIYARNGT